MPDKPMPHKILSLDGGGSWAIIQAYCLKDLFPGEKGHQILSHFDLAVANSGGSLVLAGLLANKSPDELIHMFRDEEIRLSIFKKKAFTLLNCLLGLGPKYIAREKLKGIRKALGPISQAYITEVNQNIITEKGKPIQFVIVNFDYRKNRAFFHRSNKQSLADSSYCDLYQQNLKKHVPIHEIPHRDTTLAEAVHGSSNAPVNFFDEPAKVQLRNESYTHEMWDGAVGGYNNPVLAGVIESVVNDVKPEDIKILSIGTGSNDLLLRNGTTPDIHQEIFYDTEKKSSLLNDIPKLAKSILNDPPDAASYHAYCMLGMKIFDENKRFWRFNPLIKPILNEQTQRYECPEGLNSVQFQFLANLEMDATRQTEIEMIEHLAQQWIQNKIKNQPIRRSKNEIANIGHTDYKPAKESFKEHF